MKKLQIIITTDHNHFVVFGESVPIVYCNYITPELLVNDERIERIKIKLKESIDYLWTMILASGVENNGYYVTKQKGLSALLNVITDYQFLCSIVKSEIKIQLQVVDVPNSSMIKD